MKNKSLPSPKQLTQRNLAFLLRRVTGARMNYYPHPEMFHSQEFKSYYLDYEIARKALEDMIKYELKNIQTIEEHNDTIETLKSSRQGC